MPKADIRVFPNSSTLSRKAAERFIAIGRQAIAQRGRFAVALAGGSTPEAMYIDLASAKMMPQLDWSRTYMFMSDERHVPSDDARSNYAMASRTLLSHIPPADLHAFAVPTLIPDAAESAVAYERTIREFFAHEGDDVPQFDLVLLGLGSDGHTASLFPHAPALSEKHKLVVNSPPGRLPPPVQRVTFTYPLINAAHHVIILAAGEAKADPLGQILAHGGTPSEYPAAGVEPIHGSLTYMLDEPAAAKLPASMRASA